MVTKLKSAVICDASAQWWWIKQKVNAWTWWFLKERWCYPLNGTIIFRGKELWALSLGVKPTSFCLRNCKIWNLRVKRKCARLRTSFPGPHRKKYLNKMPAVFKINRTKSKTMNRRALIGKLKDFDGGVRSLFELATDSCQNLYQTYTGDAPDLREIQTYPEWRVQMCFRNLKKHHRKRSRQKIIYILSVGPLTWKCLHFRVDQEICELLLFRNDREISGRDCRHEGEL